MIRLVSVLSWLSLLAFWIAFTILLPNVLVLAGVIFLAFVGLLVIACVLAPNIFDWLLEQKPEETAHNPPVVLEATFEEQYKKDIEKRRKAEEVKD